MGILFQQFLTGAKVYQCSQCGAHLARGIDIISKVWMVTEIQVEMPISIWIDQPWAGFNGHYLVISNMPILI
jgi:hypothetical protein